MLSIDSLPVVVQREIPKFVLEHSWCDLSALIQTSKAWHDIAAAALYKNLRIKFRNVTSLQHDISELHADGQGWQYLRHTRNLDSVCLKQPWLETKKAKRFWQKKDRASEFITFKPPATEDSSLEGFLSRFHDYYLWFLTQAQAYYEENDWEPIFGLVSRLQNLRLLNYIVMNMFPTCLYQTLERLHPNCQVNIWTPQSPSLDLPGLGRAHGHVSLGCNQPFDLNALSAPTLHTFHAVYTFDTDPQDRQRWVHIDEPFTFIFTAPNLKHLVIDARDGRGKNPLLSVKEEWQKFTLESLTFRHEAYRADERVLLNLSTMIDLSILRSLDIGVHSEPALLSQAASIVSNLVRDIFNLILSHLATRMLQRLRVDLVGSDPFKRELEHVIWQVSGSFLATRSGLHAVHVKDIGKVAWQLWREDDISQGGSIRIPKVIKDILEELWPVSTDRNRSGNWKQMPLFVKSFPLEDGLGRAQE